MLGLAQGLRRHLRHWVRPGKATHQRSRGCKPCGERPGCPGNARSPGSPRSRPDSASRVPGPEATRVASLLRFSDLDWVSSLPLMSTDHSLPGAVPGSRPRRTPARPRSHVRAAPGRASPAPPAQVPMQVVHPSRRASRSPTIEKRRPPPSHCGCCWRYWLSPQPRWHWWRAARPVPERRTLAPRLPVRSPKVKQPPPRVHHEAVDHEVVDHYALRVNEWRPVVST